MKRLLRIASVILMAIGAVWFFQGINVLPGSFMTGQTRWAVIGAVTAGVGVVAWVMSKRRA
jgi:hypothetical protein